MLLERSGRSVNGASTEMDGKRLTYPESVLGLHPLDLLAGILLYLRLSGFCGLLSSFEAFRIRIMFLRELHHRGMSQKVSPWDGESGYS